MSPVFLWAGFILLIMIFLAIDLGVFHRKTHAVSIKESLIWATVWFCVAMAFNLLVWLRLGHDLALQFFTGYIIEQSLSVDNLFVILLIFTSFKIAPRLQHRVLFWGIIGALVMRGIFIIAGAALVSRFDWIFYIFGAFLVWTAIKLFFEKEEANDPRKLVRFIRKIFPVSKKTNGDRFFVKERGKRVVTMLFVVLLIVEFSDVLFAFDSIPAIFAISTNPFIVFTSNVFAILGLRSLYFIIAKAHALFVHLKTGLAIILAFIGAKLLLRHYFEIPILLSLIVVITVLFVSIAYSIWERQMAKSS